MNKLPEHVLIIQSQGVDQARELKANPAAFIKKYNLLQLIKGRESPRF